jgi:large subunit ribosomal protein L22
MADEKKSGKKTAKGKAPKAEGAKKEPKRSVKKAAKAAAKKATKATKKAVPKPAGKKAGAKGELGKEAAPTARKAPAKEPSAPAPVVRASARYVRIAPRKARLVADQVRGLHIEQARALLEFSPRGAARDIQKLLDSAAANAENNHDLIGDEMRVSAITVDEGPTLRRYRPRALGRATPINKRTSHISVALTPTDE